MVSKRDKQMNREQAINYLISSGFSEEQVNEIVKALSQELFINKPCVSYGMTITTHRIKQYNSTYKTVISVDNQPICIVDGVGQTVSNIMAYLNGYDVVVADGRIKKILDKYRRIEKLKKEMPREVAIELLDNLIGMIEDNQNNDYDEALRMGIEALKQKRWISVSEKLPQLYKENVNGKDTN